MAPLLWTNLSYLIWRKHGVYHRAPSLCLYQHYANASLGKLQRAGTTGQQLHDANCDAWRQFAGASGAGVEIAALMGTDPVTGETCYMRPPDKQEALSS